MKLILSPNKELANKNTIVLNDFKAAVKFIKSEPAIKEVDVTAPFTKEEHDEMLALISNRGNDVNQNTIFAYIATGSKDINIAVKETISIKNIGNLLVQLGYVSESAFRKAMGEKGDEKIEGYLLKAGLINKEILAEILEKESTYKSLIINDKNKLKEKILKTPAKWLIVSLILPGTIDILEIILYARQNGFSVLLLAGDKDKKDLTVDRAEKLGAITLYSPVTVGGICNQILSG